MQARKGRRDVITVIRSSYKQWSRSTTRFLTPPTRRPLRIIRTTRMNPRPNATLPGGGAMRANRRSRSDAAARPGLITRPERRTPARPQDTSASAKQGPLPTDSQSLAPSTNAAAAAITLRNSPSRMASYGGTSSRRGLAPMNHARATASPSEPATATHARWATCRR